MTKPLPANIISSTLSHIHNQPLGQPIEQFQKNNLLWLKEQVGFEHAFWLINDQKHNMHYYAGINLLTENMAEWNQCVQEDKFMQSFSLQPGSVTTINSNDIPDINHSTTFNYYAQHYGLRQMLISVFIDQENGSPHVICLIRLTEEPKFTEEQRYLLEQTTPHLLIAWKHNCALYLYHKSTNQQHANTALVNKQGCIQQSYLEFEAILRKEWPNWAGSKLPDSLCEWLANNNLRTNDIFKGAHIQLSSNQLEDIFLLRVRENNLLDTLSEREHTVSKLFITGLSYKEIAREMGIAPSTVRNHLTKAYLRLGITSKIQLANLFNNQI